MGVTVFFVISGYLINGLLVAEYEQTGRIDLPNFWLRRVRRLFPAIALSVVGTWAACALLNPTMLSRMLPDIAPSLLFFNNWWQIFHEVSYFEAFSASSPLKHFWSLAIEEQFYLFWPPLLFLLFRKGFDKRKLAVVVAVLAVLSAIDMALLYDPMGDPSRAYYGTDTRAMSLLAGVFLAFVWSSLVAPRQTRSTAAFVVVNIIGIGALAGLIWTVGFTTGFSDFPYRGGIALTTVLSALLIAALVVPGTLVDRLFALKPLVWIGKISYGMYLWHYPVILLTTNANAASATPWYVHLFQLALTIAISAVSYYFVENPIRHGAIGAWVRDVRAGKPDVGQRAAKAAIPAACFVVLLGIAIVGTVNAPEVQVQTTQVGQLSAQSQSSRPASAASGEGASSAASASASSVSAESQSSFASSPTDASASAVALSPKRENPFTEPVYNAAGELIYEPLLIGDSVSLGAEAEFYNVFPNGCLDSVTSRNIWEAPYDEYAEGERVGSFVVFCLGTNNAVVDWQMDDLLWPVPDDKIVVLVNTRSNTDWMNSTNAAINATPDRYPNVSVADWYSASEGHEEYFAGDGTHLTEEGAEAYIELIRAELERRRTAL